MRDIVSILRRGVPFVVLCVLGGIGEAQASPRISSASAPLPAAAEIAGQGEPIAIDFNWGTPVPQEWRASIQQAMNAAQSKWPEITRFTVTAIDSGDGWWHTVLVPTYVVEAGWEVELRSSDIVDVIVVRDQAGQLKAYVRGTVDFGQLATKAPAVFRLFQPAAPIGAQEVSDMLFPWTNGQSWTRGSLAFHPCGFAECSAYPYALDFLPANSGNPSIDHVVLVAASGTVRNLCDPDGAQRALRIEHAGGTTVYLHLDQNSMAGNIINQGVPRGQFLGLLYSGIQGRGPCWINGRQYNCQFNTNCGYGTDTHLHFVVSEPGQHIDTEGETANHIANGGQRAYLSHNVRAGGGDNVPNCADGEGAVLYEHSNYTGRCTRFTSDDGNLGDNPIGSDAASSIKIIGNFQAVVYENTNFWGASSSFTGDDPDFGNDAIGHDRASSLRVSRRDASGSSNCDGGPGAYVYENSSYGGRCSKFTGDSPNPRVWYIGNDSASSIRMVGSYEATLYEHDDYNGASSTFTSDDPDLGNDAIGNDRASSIRVRQIPSGSSNCDGGDGAYFYEHANYNGRCSKFTSDSPNPRNWYVGNDAASSIRIRGNYEASVCEHDNFGGVCSNFSGDDPDFGNDAIGHDRASSIRVHQRSSGPASCDNGQFLAEYFSNRGLSGSPVFRRCENNISSDWAYGGPGNGVGNDNFSVRWTGTFWFENTGTYRFTTRTDDGVRLYVDGQLVIDQWRDMGATQFNTDRNLNAGLRGVRMEYYENGGYAVAQLSWAFQSPSPSDPDDGRTINYDDALDGTVSPAYDRDDYYFDGSAGQAITIRMDKRNSSLDSYVELYGPDGRLVGQDDDNGGNLNSRLAITLNQNGRHKIIARGYSMSTGGYRLSLSRESTVDPDDNRWIAMGGSLQGTISPNDDRDWYYVSGTAGRTVSIRMNKIDNGLDSYLELYNPSGVKVAENDDGGGDRNAWLVYSMPADGVYRILARSWSLASSGRYNLLLSPANNTNLAAGKGGYATSVEFSGVEPYKAFDSNLGTRWSSRFSDPQLIYVDLGAVRTFDQVVLRWENAYARRYGIYYWDGSGWRNVYWTDNGDGGNDTITFTPVQARYVGMYGIQRGTAWGYSLWEFEVYNTAFVLIPLVPPDPGDKGSETGVTPLVPLDPNDPSKPTVLIGEGDTGQENTPLVGMEAIDLVTGITATIPTAHIFYPSQDGPAMFPNSIILFQGEASDNDENGQAITAWEWRSDRDGVLGTQPIFTLTASSISTGTHVISLRVQDDEGDWSPTEQVTLQVMDAYSTYLPIVSK